MHCLATWLPVCTLWPKGNLLGTKHAVGALPVLQVSLPEPEGCLQTVLDALRARKDRFIFEGNDIALRNSVMAFITMNPGYPGRAELPESLKVLAPLTGIRMVKVHSCGPVGSRTVMLTTRPALHLRMWCTHLRLPLSMQGLR